MCQHRLPLFLRSDLYSEYKLSRLLATQPDHRGKGKSDRTPKTRKIAGRKNLPDARLGAASSKSDRERSASPCKTKLGDFSVTTCSSDSDFETKPAQLQLPSRIKPIDSPVSSSQSQIRLEPSNPAVTTLPSLPLSPTGDGIPRRSSLTALVSENHTPRAAVSISTSKSDVELGSRRRSRLASQQRSPHKRSLSSGTVSTAGESSRVKGSVVGDEGCSSDEATAKLTPEEYRWVQPSHCSTPQPVSEIPSLKEYM